MTCYAPKGSLWKKAEKSPIRQCNTKTIQNQTTQDILAYVSEASSPLGKHCSLRHRYKKSQKADIYPKQMLRILPAAINSKIESDSPRALSPYLARKSDRSCDYLQGDDRNLISFLEKKSPLSREDRMERRPINRMLSEQQTIQSKSPLIKQLSRKLKPILNDSKLKQLGVEAKESNEIQASLKMLRNFKATKDLFKIKRKTTRCSNTRILVCSQKQQYYRMGDEKNLCNVFNIQSFQPQFSCLLEKASASLLRNQRTSTQPSLQSGQIHEKRQPRNKSLLNNLESSNIQRQKYDPEVLNIQKPRKRKYRLKEMPFLSNINKRLIKIQRKFRVPFETYYYRDFLWKANFTNELYVEPPLQYEHRLKVYVGKGNNSCMVRGLINRRYWFAFTDRRDDANFVWTQLKQLQYFKLQKNSSNLATKIESDGNYLQRGIFTVNDMKIYQNYWQGCMRMEQNGEERMLLRAKSFKYSTVVKSEQIKMSRMHNHLKNNYVIGNKKALFKTMCHYYRHLQVDPFDYLPLTFHVTEGLEDPNFLAFQRYYHRRNKDIKREGEKKLNMWIVKPGQNTNRGNGIKICHGLKEIKQLVKNKQKWQDGSSKTYIIQSYIENPLLYKKRKFDIRHYIVITCINGCRKGYWFADGYVRTTSSEYKLSEASEAVHLTNDAIQKNLPDYGKFEKGNKLSYQQISAYIQKHYPGKSFFKDVYPSMKKMGTDIIKASINFLDQDRLENNFEIFGLDFMIDSDLKLWLIEVNSNPCLELSCPILSQIIPNLIQNVLEVTLDAVFPPPVRYSPKFPRYLNNMEEMNKLQLVFDDRVQDGFSQDQGILDNRMLQQQDDVFEDSGSEWQDN